MSMTRRAFRRRTTRLTIRLVLSLVLLIAQAGALAHFYSHAASGQDTAGLATGQAQSCGECLSFAPVAGGGAASEYALFLNVPIVERLASVTLDSAIQPVFHHAFRSRAPPHRLSYV